jgi:cyclophilin family peptidyl-prolyl cis-trans isomerase
VTVSKKQHQKQVQRARDKRRQQQQFQRRQRRQRVIVLVMVGLMVLSLVAVGLGSLFADDPGTPQVDAFDDPDAATEADDEVAAEGPCPPPGDDLPTPVSEAYDEPPRYDLDPDATYVATLVTTCGDITIELDADGAPRTVENFLALAEDGYYAGTPFHRIAPDFVAQGGDPTGTGTGCVDEACEVQLPGYELEDELATAEALGDGGDGEDAGVVEYPRGTVAMANRGPDTQGSQFFVVQADPGYLFPPAYTILGQVTDGMEVVDDIVAGPVVGDQAIDPVVVLEVRIETS